MTTDEAGIRRAMEDNVAKWLASKGLNPSRAMAESYDRVLCGCGCGNPITEREGRGRSKVYRRGHSPIAKAYQAIRHA